MFTAESYTYDPWGNILTLGANTTTQPNYVGCTQESGFNYNGAIAANNRIAASGFSYDAAGNMTASPGFTYVYDAENHLTSTAGVTYAYDGDGKRLSKSSGTMYWYGTNSDPLIETDLSNNLKSHYIFFNGQRVASDNGSNQVNWYFADHLGSSRLVFSVNGDDQSDFYPFGGERVMTTGAGNHYKFTGKERDAESGLDNFGARYMSSVMGRFMTPDWAAKPVSVPYANFGDPQSLNLYTYVGNHSLLHTDADGHCCSWSASSVSDWVNTKVNSALTSLGTSAARSGSSTGAAAATFAAGVLGSVAKAVFSPLSLGEATGTCLGGNGCSAGQTALAVGGDLLKAGAIAAPAAGLLGSGTAAAAAQDALNAAAQGSRAGAMIGAFDTQTGSVAVGVSGDLSRLGSINPQIAAAADQVGGIGAVNPGTAAPVGCCAEVDAANQLTNAGSSLGDISFTDAIRPRTGDPVPPCANCQEMFPQIKKPD